LLLSHEPSQPSTTLRLSEVSFIQADKYGQHSSERFGRSGRLCENAYGQMALYVSGDCGKNSKPYRAVTSKHQEQKDLSCVDPGQLGSGRVLASRHLAGSIVMILTWIANTFLR